MRSPNSKKKRPRVANSKEGENAGSIADVLASVPPSRILVGGTTRSNAGSPPQQSVLTRPLRAAALLLALLCVLASLAYAPGEREGGGVGVGGGISSEGGSPQQTAAARSSLFGSALVLFGGLFVGRGTDGGTTKSQHERDAGGLQRNGTNTTMASGEIAEIDVSNIRGDAGGDSQRAKSLSLLVQSLFGAAMPGDVVVPLVVGRAAGAAGGALSSSRKGKEAVETATSIGRGGEQKGGERKKETGSRNGHHHHRRPSIEWFQTPNANLLWLTASDVSDVVVSKNPQSPPSRHANGDAPPPKQVSSAARSEGNETEINSKENDGYMCMAVYNSGGSGAAVDLDGSPQRSLSQQREGAVAMRRWATHERSDGGEGMPPPRSVATAPLLLTAPIALAPPTLAPRSSSGKSDGAPLPPSSSLLVPSFAEMGCGGTPAAAPRLLLVRPDTFVDWCQSATIIASKDSATTTDDATTVMQGGTREGNEEKSGDGARCALVRRGRDARILRSLPSNPSLPACGEAESGRGKCHQKQQQPFAFVTVAPSRPTQPLLAPTTTSPTDALSVAPPTKEERDTSYNGGRRVALEAAPASVADTARRWFRDKLTAALLFDWHRYFLDADEWDESDERTSHSSAPSSVSSSVAAALFAPNSDAGTTGAGTAASSSLSDASALAQWHRQRSGLMAKWRRHVIRGENSFVMWSEKRSEKVPDGGKGGKPRHNEGSSERGKVEKRDCGNVRIAIVSHHGYHPMPPKTANSKPLPQRASSASDASTSVAEKKKGNSAAAVSGGNGEKKEPRRKKGPSDKAGKATRAVRAICPPVAYFASARWARADVDASMTGAPRRHVASASLSDPRKKSEEAEKVTSFSNSPFLNSPTRPTVKEMLLLERSEEAALKRLGVADHNGLNNDDEGLKYRSARTRGAVAGARIPSLGTSSSPASLRDLLAVAIGEALAETSATQNTPVRVERGGQGEGSASNTKKQHNNRHRRTVVGVDFEYGSSSSGGGTHPASEGASLSSTAARLLQLHGPTALAFATDRPWAALAELPHIHYVLRFAPFSANPSPPPPSSMSREPKGGGEKGNNDDEDDDNSIDIVLNGCELMYYLTFAMTANGDDSGSMTTAENDMRRLLAEALLAPLIARTVLAAPSETLFRHSVKEALKITPLLANALPPTVFNSISGNGNTIASGGGDAMWKVSDEERAAVAAMDVTAAMRRLAEKLRIPAAHIVVPQRSRSPRQRDAVGEEVQPQTPPAAAATSGYALVALFSRRLFDPTHPSAFAPGRTIAAEAEEAHANPFKPEEIGRNSSGETDNSEGGSDAAGEADLARSLLLQSIADGFGPSTAKSRIGTVGGGGTAATDNSDEHWHPDAPSVFRQATITAASDKNGMPMAAAVIPVAVTVRRGNGGGGEVAISTNKDSDAAHGAQSILAFAADPTNGHMGGLSSEAHARAAVVGAHVPVGGDGEGKTGFMRNASLLNKRLYSRLMGYDLYDNDDDIEAAAAVSGGEGKEGGGTGDGEVSSKNKPATETKTEKGKRRYAMEAAASEGLRGRPPYWSKLVYLHRALSEELPTGDAKPKREGKGSSLSSDYNNKRRKRREGGAEAFDNLLLGDYFGDLFVELSLQRWEEWKREKQQQKKKEERSTLAEARAMPLKRRVAATRRTVLETYNALVRLLVEVALPLPSSSPAPSSPTSAPGRPLLGDDSDAYGTPQAPPLFFPHGLGAEAGGGEEKETEEGEAATTRGQPLVSKHRSTLLAMLTIPNTTEIDASIPPHPALAEVTAIKEAKGEEVHINAKAIAERRLMRWFGERHRPLLAQLFARFLSNRPFLSDALFADDNDDAKTLGKKSGVKTATAMMMRCLPAADIHSREKDPSSPSLLPLASLRTQRVFSDGSWLNTPNTALLNRNVAAFYGVPTAEWGAMRRNVRAKLESRAEETEESSSERDREEEAVPQLGQPQHQNQHNSLQQQQQRWPGPPPPLQPLRYCYAMLQADFVRAVLLYSGGLPMAALGSTAALQKAFDSPQWARRPRAESAWAVDGGMGDATAEELLAAERKAEVEGNEGSGLNNGKKEATEADVRRAFFSTPSAATGRAFTIAQLSLPRRLADGRPLPKTVSPLGAQLLVVSEEDTITTMAMVRSEDSADSTSATSSGGGGDSSPTAAANEPEKKAEESKGMAGGNGNASSWKTIEVPPLTTPSVFGRLSVHHPSSLAFASYAAHCATVERRAAAVLRFSSANDVSLLAVAMAEIREEREREMEKEEEEKSKEEDNAAAQQSSLLPPPPPPLAHDYVLWIDNDALITNMTIPLEALLANTLLGGGAVGIAYGREGGDDTGLGGGAEWAPMTPLSASELSRAAAKHDEKKERSERIDPPLLPLFDSDTFLRSLNADFPTASPHVLPPIAATTGAAAAQRIASGGGGGHWGNPLWRRFADAFDAEVLRSGPSADQRKKLPTTTSTTKSSSSSTAALSAFESFPFDLRVPFESLGSDGRSALTLAHRKERIELMMLSGPSSSTTEQMGSEGRRGGRKEVGNPFSSSSSRQCKCVAKRTRKLSMRRAMMGDAALKAALRDYGISFFADVPFEDGEGGVGTVANRSLLSGTDKEEDGGAVDDCRCEVEDSSSRNSSIVSEKEEGEEETEKEPVPPLHYRNHIDRRARYHDALTSIGAAIPQLVGRGFNPGNKLPASPARERRYALRDALSLGGTMRRRRMRFLLSADELAYEYHKLQQSIRSSQRYRGSSAGGGGKRGRKAAAQNVDVEAEMRDTVRTPFEDARHQSIPGGHASPPHLVDIVAASQSLILNNGVFFLRNSPWVRHYWLPLWWHAPNHTWSWYDNGAFIHTLADECVGQPQGNRNRRHLAIAPGRVLNAYFRGGNFRESNLAAADRIFRKRDVAFTLQYYQPGDWSIHFPTFGPYELQCRFWCEALRRAKHLLAAQGTLEWDDLAVGVRHRGGEGKGASSTPTPSVASNASMTAACRSSPLPFAGSRRVADGDAVYMTLERFPLTNQCRRDLLTILDMTLPL